MISISKIMVPCHCNSSVFYYVYVVKLTLVLVTYVKNLQQTARKPLHCDRNSDLLGLQL